MTGRIDGIQVAIPRAVVDVQQQQHAAIRQPVVAQDLAAAQVRGEVRAREIRPEELQRSSHRRVREDGVEGVDERDARQQDLARERRRGRPVVAAALPPAAVPPPLAAADGKGRRVDLKL